MTESHQTVKRPAFLAFFVGLLLLGAVVADAADNRKKVERQPIQITSDRLEAFNEERLVVFAGHAVAVQGDRVIRADRINVYYKKKSDENKSPVAPDANLGQGGDLDRIVALGKVRITQRDRVVTGDEATYYQDDQKIVVTGHAVLRENENVVRGDRITVLINEKKGVVEGTPAKRVTATIYPAEEGGKKK